MYPLNCHTANPSTFLLLLLESYSFIQNDMPWDAFLISVLFVIPCRLLPANLLCCSILIILHRELAQVIFIAFKIFHIFTGFQNFCFKNSHPLSHIHTVFDCIQFFSIEYLLIYFHIVCFLMLLKVKLSMQNSLFPSRRRL